MPGYVPSLLWSRASGHRMTREAPSGPRPLQASRALPDRLDDADLVSALASGDKSALGELYDRHVGTALGLANRILRDPREAEDIVHDVFLELWRRSSTYRPEAASVRTWLLLMVRSRCFDRRGSATRRLTVSLGDANDVGTPGDDASPDCRRIGPLLDELPKNQKDAIVLGYYDGLSSSEIAQRLSVPIGTVKSRVAAALANLRDSLAAPLPANVGASANLGKTP